MKVKKSSLDAAADEAKGGGAFIAARHRNPAEELAAQGAGGSDKLGGICAIIATVLMIVVTVVLYLNWDAIKSA